MPRGDVSPVGSDDGFFRKKRNVPDNRNREVYSSGSRREERSRVVVSYDSSRVGGGEERSREERSRVGGKSREVGYRSRRLPTSPDYFEWKAKGKAPAREDREEIARAAFRDMQVNTTPLLRPPSDTRSRSRSSSSSRSLFDGSDISSISGSESGSESSSVSGSESGSEGRVKLRKKPSIGDLKASYSRFASPSPSELSARADRLNTIPQTKRVEFLLPRERGASVQSRSRSAERPLGSQSRREAALRTEMEMAYRTYMTHLDGDYIKTVRSIRAQIAKLDSRLEYSSATGGIGKGHQLFSKVSELYKAFQALAKTREQLWDYTEWKETLDVALAKMSDVSHILPEAKTREYNERGREMQRKSNIERDKYQPELDILEENIAHYNALKRDQGLVYEQDHMGREAMKKEMKMVHRSENAEWEKYLRHLEYIDNTRLLATESQIYTELQEEQAEALRIIERVSEDLEKQYREQINEWDKLITGWKDEKDSQIEELKQEKQKAVIEGKEVLLQLAKDTLAVADGLQKQIKTIDWKIRGKNFPLEFLAEDANLFAKAMEEILTKAFRFISAD